MSSKYILRDPATSLPPFLSFLLACKYISLYKLLRNEIKDLMILTPIKMLARDMENMAAIVITQTCIINYNY